MQTVHAYARTSHSYRDGWRHLDSDKFLATVKLTPPTVVEAGQGYDEGDTYVQYVRVPRNVDSKELAQALRDTIGGSNCKHEYDCCGCATRHVRVKRTSNRQLQVRTRVSYNY